MLEILSKITKSSKKNPIPSAKKNIPTLNVVSSSNVEIRFEVVNYYPSSAKYITIKHIRPAQIAVECPKALSRLLARLSFP